MSKSKFDNRWSVSRGRPRLLSGQASIGMGRVGGGLPVWAMVALWLVGGSPSVRAEQEYQKSQEYQKAVEGIEVLPDTEPLTWSDDIASRMVDAIDAFLLRKTGDSRGRREEYWRKSAIPSDLPAGGEADPLAEERAALAKILGMADQRVAVPELQVIASPGCTGRVGSGQGYEVYAVRWPAFGDVTGEGLWLVPTGEDSTHLPGVVAVPDADVTPEMLTGLVEGVPPECRYAAILAAGGCRVLVPTLVSREIAARRNVQLTHREFIYRPAYELGRHIIGYEIQKVLAGVDYLRQHASPDARVGVIGWGEGGMLAMYAAAVDPRIDAVCISGYFGP